MSPRVSAALLVMLGGALGALARFAAGSAVAALVGRDRPWWGTFAVNVAGCFLLGLAVAFLRGAGQATEPWRSGLVIGFLGAFTTFSTFAYEGDALLTAGPGGWWRAAAYLLGSVAAGLAALRLGYAVGGR